MHAGLPETVRPIFIDWRLEGLTSVPAGGQDAVVPAEDGCNHRPMPTISSFYGILIRMYFGDHPPPHFHVRYGEHKARFEIATGQQIDGELPPRRPARSGVGELHEEELERNWRRCEQRQPLEPVEPLS